MYTVDQLNDKLIDLAFSEDIGDGDHTTLCCIPENAMGKSRLLIKEEGILAGMRIAKEIFHRFDPTMQVEQFMEDGTHVKPGDVPMIVTGKVRSLLQTERLMLNVMQRMSGIATMTTSMYNALKVQTPACSTLAKQPQACVCLRRRLSKLAAAATTVSDFLT